jgi:hypothetical protein
MGAEDISCYLKNAIIQHGQRLRYGILWYIVLLTAEPIFAVAVLPGREYVAIHVADIAAQMQPPISSSKADESRDNSRLRIDVA